MKTGKHVWVKINGTFVKALLVEFGRGLTAEVEVNGKRRTVYKLGLKSKPPETTTSPPEDRSGTPSS